MMRRILSWSTRCAGAIALSALVSSVFVNCSSDEEPPAAGGRGGAGGQGGVGGIILDSGNPDGNAGSDSGNLAPCSSLNQLAGCGTQNVQAQIKTPNILLVIDKSGSMDATPTGFPSSKWLALKSALGTALGEVADGVNFGLLLYPFSTSRTIPADCQLEECCSVPDASSAVRVPVAVGTTSVPQINDALDRTAPGGGTPTAAALARAYDYYTTGPGAALQGEKFVMLATDGGPNCNATVPLCDADRCTTNLDGTCSLPTGTSCCRDNNLPALCLDDAAVLEQVTKLKDAGVPTFVVGIPGTEAYAGFLDPIAEAGGRPAPAGSPRKFYAVSAQGGVEGLVKVFREITTQLVRSCEIELGKNPPDINKVNVAVDCDIVPQKQTEGDAWSIDQSTNPNKLIFQGKTCKWIQDNGANRVDVVYGCNPIQ